MDSFRVKNSSSPFNQSRSALRIMKSSIFWVHTPVDILLEKETMVTTGLEAGCVLELVWKT
jgi:hypothetical protein